MYVNMYIYVKIVIEDYVFIINWIKYKFGKLVC